MEVISLICLAIVLGRSGSEDARDNKDLKLRHTMRREAKKRHATYASQILSKFGNELPSFAFDFSELIVGAVIERSLDSDDLHLAVIMMGHKTTTLKDDSCPFKSISTDISTVEGWTKACDAWKNSGSISHTTRNHSGVSCRLQNDANSQTYYTSAAWIPSEGFANDKFDGMFEVLRCRVKFAHHAYRVLSHSEESLHVDIISRQSTEEQGKMVISFAVPWRTRHTGFGLKFDNGSSLFDPWQIHHPRQKINFVVIPSIFAQGQLSSESTVLRSIPNIIRFVEYYTSIGIDHIFINVPLSTNSPLMMTMLQAFSHYVDRGHLTLVSTALQGVDGATGMLGMIFKDWLTQSILHTSLLYLSKGIASYLLVAPIEEFLAITDSQIVSIQQLIETVHPSKSRSKHCFYGVSFSNDYNPLRFFVSTRYNGE